MLRPRCLTPPRSPRIPWCLIFYTPSRKTETEAGAALNGINLATVTVVKVLKALLVSFLLAVSAPLAQAHIVYPGCYVPPDSAIGEHWYFDPVYGTTVNGGADGSKAHPFKDLSYAFQTGLGRRRRVPEWASFQSTDSRQWGYLDRLLGAPISLRLTALE